MLDILGRKYIVDTCISFLRNLHEQRLYKTYITDILSAMATQSGVKVNCRFADFYETHKKIVVDAKSVKEKILKKFRKEE